MRLCELDLNKTLFVEHCDLDGIMPYILSKFFNIDYFKFISTNYNEDLELEFLQSGLYENVIYVDFTPSELCRKVIVEHEINCIIIDHHIAVKEEINQFCNTYTNVEYIFDNEKCGTKLYYEWLKEQGYNGNVISDYIVELTNTYDLYKQDSELWDVADKLNRLLYASCAWYILKTNPTNRIEAYKFFINTILWKMENSDHFFFNNLETQKINSDLKKEQEIFDNLINNVATEVSTRKDSEGNYFAVFTCNSKISAIASRMLKKYKSLKYCVIINEYDIENPKISLRSKDEFDLLRLNYASGHSNASGINSNEIEDMKKFVEDLKSKKIYELGYKENIN